MPKKKMEAKKKTSKKYIKKKTRLRKPKKFAFMSRIFHFMPENVVMKGGHSTDILVS